MASMDLNIFIVLTVIPLFLALMTKIDRNKLFTLFPFMGGLISIYATAALGQAGSITTNYSGTANTLASAGTLTWTAVILIPEMLTLICFVFMIARVLGRI